MKRVLVFASFMLLLSIASSTAGVQTGCNARCYWSDQEFDCFLDAPGPQCGSMSNPVPYSCYVPCNCCVVIKPFD